MSKPKPDQALDRLRSADPAPTAEVEARMDAADRQRLRERAIGLGESDSDRRLGGPRPRSRRRRLALRLAGVAAGAAVVGAAALIGFDSPNGGERPEFAQGAIEVAEANPRLLVTEPGWSVTHANWISGPEHGSMIFSDGESELEATWTPAKDHRLFVNDRRHDAAESREIAVSGRQGILFRYDGTDLTTIFEPEGPVYLEVRGDLGSRERYLEVLRSLEPVDVETWLSALPPEVVQPGARASVVEEMLEGIPLPPGFDRERLEESGPANISDRYQLAAYVTQAAMCAWLDRWTEAKRAGDTAVEKEAVEAMLTSKDWPALREIQHDGGWSQAVWEHADTVASGNGPPKDVYDQTMNCLEHP